MSRPIQQVAGTLSFKLRLMLFHATNKWESYFTYTAYKGHYLQYEHVAVRSQLWALNTYWTCNIQNSWTFAFSAIDPSVRNLSKKDYITVGLMSSPSSQIRYVWPKKENFCHVCHADFDEVPTRITFSKVQNANFALKKKQKNLRNIILRCSMDVKYGAKKELWYWDFIRNFK